MKNRHGVDTSNRKLKIYEKEENIYFEFESIFLFYNKRLIYRIVFNSSLS